MITSIGFMKAPNTCDEAFTYDEIDTGNMIQGDGFVAAIKETVRGIKVRSYFELGNGYYEQANPTDHIKELVHKELGINPDNYTEGSSLNGKKEAAKARREAKLEKQLAKEKEQGITIRPNPVVIEESKSVDTSSKAITDLLEQCTGVIAELRTNLYTAQVECYSLASIMGSQHRATRAKAQLIEKGLIKGVGKGTELTELGQDMAIGTHVRNPDTKAQFIRYSPKVLDYIDLTKTGSVKKESPFEKTVPVFQVKNPEGVVFTIESVNSFAKEHGLKHNKLYLLRKGVIQQHHGWTLV